MKTDTLVAQIEIYSNAIVGFVVLQAITYSVSFGTSEMFNCLVKTSKFLAHGIVLHFAVATALACFAVLALGRHLRTLSAENVDIVRHLYWAKCVTIIFFTSLPMAATTAYGIVEYPSKYDCKQQLKKGP